MVTGFGWIIKLTVVSGLLSAVFGTILLAMRVSPVPVLRVFAASWVHIFRNSPLALILFFCYFALYSTLGLVFSKNLQTNNFWLGVVGLTAYTSAFVCEALRAGINTLPQGQIEAARALGLTFMQTLTLVVIPQAGRAIIAPAGSILIALVKNSTVVGTIGLLEASSVMKDLINSNGDAVIQIFVVFAAIFCLIIIPIGYLAGFLSRKLEVRR